MRAGYDPPDVRQMRDFCVGFGPRREHAMSVNAKSTLFIFPGTAYSAILSVNFSFRMRISAYYIALKAVCCINTACIKNPL